MREAVILVHGMWMGAWAMQGLKLQLSRRGFGAYAFGYRSTAHSLDEHARSLAARIAALNETVIHLVGHSLGGLVVLRCLRDHGEQRVGRIVLLGTPARASIAARRLEEMAAGEWLLGSSRDIWRSLPEVFRPRSELGVIAGSRPWGVGRLVLRLPGTNDGVVRLDETEVPGMRERIVLPVSHSGMLLSARVAREVAAFLERGTFGRENRGGPARKDRAAVDGGSPSGRDKH